MAGSGASGGGPLRGLRGSPSRFSPRAMLYRATFSCRSLMVLRFRATVSFSAAFSCSSSRNGGGNCVPPLAQVCVQLDCYVLLNFLSHSTHPFRRLVGGATPP